MVGDSTSSLELPLKDQLLHVVAEQVNPVEVAITVAQIIDSNVNADHVRREIHRISKSVDGPTTDAIVEAMREDGFCGQRRSPGAMHNNRIDQALQYKTANPITLAMVVIGVAKYVEVDCYGVNFPQHFLASVSGKLVDPLEMEIVSEKDLEAFARSRGVRGRNIFVRASNADIAVRMLNNVSLALDTSSSPVEAFRILDYKALLAPSRVEILMERAGLWIEAGELGMARELLEKALVSTNSDQLKEHIRKRIQSLSDNTETLN